MQISTFCHFCHHKREFDVILMYNTGLHVMTGFLNLFCNIWQWLILYQFFHKWRNMVKFYKEFIFGIIERNLQISIFCHFCHQKSCTICKWCVLQLVLFNFLKAENIKIVYFSTKINILYYCDTYVLWSTCKNSTQHKTWPGINYCRTI